MIRWAFTRFYREFAWTYDSVAWLVSRGLWQRWTLAALPYLSGRVLELGCGPGYVQRAAPLQHRDLVVGLDSSAQMLAIARRRIRRRAFDARLVRARAQHLPFRPASFDTILATFPAEYVLAAATIAEIQRVLNPDGQVVFVDAAQFTRTGPYEQATDALYRATLHRSVCEQQRRYPPADLLTDAGFHVVEHWEVIGPSRVMVAVGTRSHAIERRV